MHRNPEVEWDPEARVKRWLGCLADNGGAERTRLGTDTVGSEKKDLVIKMVQILIFYDFKKGPRTDCINQQWAFNFAKVFETCPAINY